MLVYISILDICRCRNKSVLGVRYAVLDYTWLVGLVIQLHLLYDRLDKVLAISLVINREIGSVAYLIGLRP